MQAYIIRDPIGYGAPTSANYYSKHKPIELFYKLRLGEEKKEYNTFLTFGIQGLYETDEYRFLGWEDLWYGYRITNSQIGTNVGVKRDYRLSKHCYLSIGGQLSYRRNRLIVDTTTWTEYFFEGVRYWHYVHYVDRTYQNVFSGTLNIGFGFHLSNRFSIETTLSAGPRYIQTSDHLEGKGVVTFYFDPYTGARKKYASSGGGRSPRGGNSIYSLAFNSRINIVLYYKLNNH
jgi:hypothetical protein